MAQINSMADPPPAKKADPAKKDVTKKDDATDMLLF